MELPRIRPLSDSSDDMPTAIAYGLFVGLFVVMLVLHALARFFLD
jgi:multidrug transporter EmrE-like cation transporter